MSTSASESISGPTYEDLLQFLYVVPVGMIQCDESGLVELINPAATRLLAPAMEQNDLMAVFPLLSRLCPALWRDLTTPPFTVGPIGGTQRYLAITSATRDLHVEFVAVRVSAGRLMLVVLDVTLEGQFIEHERAQMTDLNHAVVQGLVAAETALGLGDIERARHHVSRSADAGRAWLGRQLELLGGHVPSDGLDLVRSDWDEQHSGRPE
ncbi:hypothetical protein V3N99_03290 [Dermatophilaceae bacterium Soc4.6]